jgi:molybdenum cofactor synthesis domain-containing protein
MEKRAIMQSANPVLPVVGFTEAQLLPPRQAIVAFFSRIAIALPQTERVALDAALGRVLAEPAVADRDYPAAPRSLMDGFAVRAGATPGEFEIVDGVCMGRDPHVEVTDESASRIPTGGVLPGGADAVVPIEDARVMKNVLAVDAPVAAGANVVQRAADMRRGEVVIKPHRRIRAGDVGVLATLGITEVPVYRRPTIAVFSSGDELVDPSATPSTSQIRDSNRHAVAASLRAMGAMPRHYPTLRDEAEEFESSLAIAIAQCDAVVVTGGSSVGERDRLPNAVAAIADPGILVHGLRVKPGKPTLFGAAGNKPILGLPGNPTSALVILEAVAAPIVAALVGAPLAASTLQARLAERASSRLNWTWYVPVRLQDDGGVPLAHPLPLGSFSVSLTARADGYIVLDEREEGSPAGTLVTVYRFLGA